MNFPHKQFNEGSAQKRIKNLCGEKLRPFARVADLQTSGGKFLRQETYKIVVNEGPISSARPKLSITVDTETAPIFWSKMVDKYLRNESAVCDKFYKIQIFSKKPRVLSVL